MFCHFGVKLRIPGNRLCPPVSFNQKYMVFNNVVNLQGSDLGPESVHCILSFEDGVLKSHYNYESQVELYSLDPGYRTRTRFRTGESSSTNTRDRHVPISVIVPNKTH